MTNTPNYGITVEDLEKAASVRLFEKAAAAEGIDLNQLSSSEVDELYYNYQQSSEENTMNDQIFDLFEKQAAYEGVDLESLSDEELAYVFNNFVENMSNDEDAEAVNEFLSDKTAAVYDLLMQKEAGVMDSVKGYASAGAQKAKDAGAAAVQMAKNNPKSAIGAGLATAGLAGYGAKKMYDKRKAKAAMEKEAAESTMLEAFDSFLVDNHGVSSADLDEDTFNNTYNEFLDMVANDVVTEAAEEEDAYEKLAEAEILGRHMARAYMDEMEKEAGMMGRAMDTGKELLSGLTGSRVRKLQEAGKGLTGDLLDYNNEALAAAKKYSRNVRLGAAGATAAAGAGGYGAKKMYDKRKASQEKTASILVDLFEKQAASEGIDTSLYADHVVEHMYSNFLDMLTDEDVALIKEAAEVEELPKGSFASQLGGAVGGSVKKGLKGAGIGGTIGGLGGAILAKRLGLSAAQGAGIGAGLGTVSGGSLGGSLGGYRGGIRGAQRAVQGEKGFINNLKNSFKKEAALETAAQYLIDNGIDPVTGEWL